MLPVCEQGADGGRVAGRQSRQQLEVEGRGANMKSGLVLPVCEQGEAVTFAAGGRAGSRLKGRGQTKT